MTRGPPVSLRLGHATALTTHRVVIHYRVAASLPPRGRLRIERLRREKRTLIRQNHEGFDTFPQGKANVRAASPRTNSAFSVYNSAFIIYNLAFSIYNLAFSIYNSAFSIYNLAFLLPRRYKKLEASI